MKETISGLEPVMWNLDPTRPSLPPTQRDVEIAFMSVSIFMRLETYIEEAIEVRVSVFHLSLYFPSLDKHLLHTDTECFSRPQRQKDDMLLLSELFCTLLLARTQNTVL